MLTGHNSCLSLNNVIYIYYIYNISIYISSNNYVLIFMYKILWGISVTILIDFVSLWRTSLWGLASVYWLLWLWTWAWGSTGLGPYSVLCSRAMCRRTVLLRVNVRLQNGHGTRIPWWRWRMWARKLVSYP